MTTMHPIYIQISAHSEKFQMLHYRSLILTWTNLFYNITLLFSSGQCHLIKGVLTMCINTFKEIGNVIDDVGNNNVNFHRNNVHFEGNKISYFKSHMIIII